jgi:hypothetical protein
VNPDSWGQKVSLKIDVNREEKTYNLVELNSDNFNALNFEEPIVLFGTNSSSKYVFQISDFLKSYYYLYNLNTNVLEYLTATDHGSWSCGSFEGLNSTSCHSAVKVSPLYLKDGRLVALSVKNSVSDDKIVSQKFYLAVRHLDKDVYDFPELPGNPKSIYNLEVSPNDSLKMISQTENEIIFETINRIEKHKYKLDLVNLNIVQLE